MTTLIVPCAGRSTRFEGMRPKWLLTYPDGELMIQKAVQHMHLDSHDRIVFVIVKAHSDEYSAELILRQAFADRKDQIQVSVLDGFTNGPAETVVQAIVKEKIEGPILVKDSDNDVAFELPEDTTNYVVGSALDKLPEVNDAAGKSYLNVNEQGFIVDIVEKKIVSGTIALGVYSFSDANAVKTVFEEISADQRATGEIFMSHIISYLLHKKYSQYSYVQASLYEDWGTLAEWRKVQKRFRTVFCDIDGVIYKNRGRYGKQTWADSPDVILENIAVIKQFASNGGQLVLTTARPPEFKSQIESEMKELGIPYHDIILGLNHSQRTIINDFAPTNPYPSCTAINVPRDDSLSAYFEV